MKKILVMMMLMVICISLISGCSQPAENTEVGGEALTISGLADEDIIISIEEVISHNPVTADVTAIDSAGNEEEYSVKGTLFNDLLASYEISQKDLYAIRLVAGDGYQIEVPFEVLSARDVILAYEINGEPLDEATQPLRAIVPDERAMYWVRNLLKIEILESSEHNKATRVILMETAFNQIEQEDYTYYESTDKAIKISELMTAFGMDTPIETVSFVAVDGLEKNETGEIFKNSYLKVTGEDVPLFLSPDMPKGMYIKNILFCTISDTVFMSGRKAIEKYETIALDDGTGIYITEIFEDVDFDTTGTYFITSADGDGIEVSSDELLSGIIMVNSEGGFDIQVSEDEKIFTIKDVLCIEKNKN